MLKAAARAVVSLALLAHPAVATDVTMRFTLQVPVASDVGGNLVHFKEAVEDLSSGEIAVEIYDSAVLYKDKEVGRAVGSGAIEAGYAPLTRYAGEIPAVDIFYMPFLFNDVDKVKAATAKGAKVRTIIEEAVAETGSTLLWWVHYGRLILLSNGGPIATPDDIAGKKVRVFSRTMGDIISAAGGVPTLIAGSEQYVAYQRGTVDVGTTGVPAIKSNHLHEVMDTVTIHDMVSLDFIVVVNTAWWESLSDQQRGWIEEAAARAEAQRFEALEVIEAEAYALGEEKGMQFYQPTEAEVEMWKTVSQPIYDDFRARAGERGARLLEAAGAPLD